MFKYRGMKKQVTLSSAMMEREAPGGHFAKSIDQTQDSAAKRIDVMSSFISEGGFANIITRSSHKDVNHSDSKKWWQEASVRVTDSITFVCNGNNAKTL